MAPPVTGTNPNQLYSACEIDPSSRIWSPDNEIEIPRSVQSSLCFMLLISPSFKIRLFDAFLSLFFGIKSDKSYNINFYKG